VTLFSKTFTPISLVALLAFVCCENPGSDELGTGGLLIVVDDLTLSRTIQPSTEELKLSSYTYTVLSPSEKKIVHTITEKTFSIEGIQTGLWNVTVTGNNGSLVPVASDSTTISITPKHTAICKVCLAPIIGDGELGLTVTWPSSVFVDGVVAKLIKVESNTITFIEMTIEEKKASSSTIAIPTGSYLLYISLMSGDRVIVTPKMEAVQIYANLLSSAQYSFNSENIILDGGYPVPSSDSEKFAVKLPSEKEYFDEGATKTFIASASTFVDNYYWYIDGIKIAGENSSSISFGNELSPGPHFLTIIAQKGATIVSDDVLISSSLASWEKIASDIACGARDSAGELVYNDQIWILGGYTPTRMNDVWSSYDGKTWELISASAPWAGRNLAISIVFDDKMWIMGGLGKDGTSFNDVWFSVDGKNWTLATDVAPWSERGAATGLVYDNKMWIFGGFRQSDFTHYADVWYSEDGINWIQATADAPWGARAMHASVVFDNKMWILGGGQYFQNHIFNGNINYNDVWNSRDGKNWVQVTNSAPWEPRRFHQSIVFDGQIWLLQGFSEGRNLNDIWCSTDGQNWYQRTASSIWDKRHESSILVFNSKILLIGGNSTPPLQSDIWVYSQH
jgi:hypothetical protein